MEKFKEITEFIKKQFPKQDFIPLHEPRFVGNERKYVLDAIDSTFVSSVGEYVNGFEKMMAEIAGTKYAVATVNGTAALHIALVLADVNREDEVISQALTFIATLNAISYIGASAVFIDVDEDSLGMSPKKLKAFLEENAEMRNDGFAYNKRTGKRIKACVPMHTFGLPCRVDELAEICKTWNISLVEDAAESIGSYYKGKHTGSFGLIGTFSFNGNKTVTCGGGGAIVTDNEAIAKLAKHLTTQAKVPHRWEFAHDHIGYNYRMPNLNAAMMCAQLEQLNSFVENKRELAHKYQEFFNQTPIRFVSEIFEAKSNYWLSAIMFDDRNERDAFLAFANENGVMSRPAWTLMNKLPMFAGCQNDGLQNSQKIEDRLVNIPSSVRI
jgi:aminotransferase in exopolysaccharide biosynthesis